MRTFVAAATSAPGPSSSARVVVSILVYEPVMWVHELVNNTLSLTEQSTLLILHLNENTRYAESDVERWGGSRSAVNPVRLPVEKHAGSTIYAHLLNARHASWRWDLNVSTSFFVMMASNQLWLRPGMEERVRALRCSVGREGWIYPHRSFATQAMLIAAEDGKRGPPWRTPGNIITARFYLNLTHGRRYPDGKHARSYHEGAFYPLGSVLRFKNRLEAALPRDQIFAATNNPEEWWLQAFILNEDRWQYDVPTQKFTQQLCLRYHASDVNSLVPDAMLRALANDLACSGAWPSRIETHRYYAAKRFDRNSSEAAQWLREAWERRHQSLAQHRREPGDPGRNSSWLRSEAIGIACKRARVDAERWLP